MRSKVIGLAIPWLTIGLLIGLANSNDLDEAYVTVHAYKPNDEDLGSKKSAPELTPDYYDAYYDGRNRSHGVILDDRIYQYYAGSISGPADYYAELSAGQTERGLFPNIFNLASNSIISANGTCGQRSPESFCKLVEHVYNRQPQCDMCDDLNPSKRHPIEYAVDGTSRWWQSPSLATGLQYEWVTITLDLRQQYQVAYVVLKSAIAPRPGNWVLERSLDGVTYRPWQYYAVNDEECERIYGIPAVRGIPKFNRDDEVICTSLYSRLDPLENGEIHTSLVNSRPGIDGPSELLQNFTKARYVRFRFQRLRTLNSDLIYVTHGHIDKSVTRRYYYAISDISIGGQCICYGHAEHCPVDPTTGQMKCECKHNTTGESCKECLALYNQKPWRSGTSTNPHACEPCQCFNHADRCEYDPEIEKQRLSLTPDGIYEGGGVCVNCRDNTIGVNCQECKQNYYRPTGVSPYSPDACRPCQCDRTGSPDGSCVKDETFARDGLNAGDCYCKPGFGGPRCDRCDIGFKNYPQCEPCPCNRAGSANYAYCGDTCVCKKNVEGTFCDRCKPGTFNLDESNPDGCTPCFCFGVTDQCRELDWLKIQVRDLKDWTLTDADGQKSVQPPVNATSDIALTLNIREIPDRSLFYWKAPESYVGYLLTSYGGYLSYFVYYVADSSGSNVPLPDVVLKGDSHSLEYYSRQEFRERENVSVRIRLHESSAWYDSKSRKPADKLQLMSALASVKTLMIRSTYHQQQVQASIYGVSLDSASKAIVGSKDKMSSVENCVCPTTYTGLSCEGCFEGYRRVNNVLYGGKCELCVCHGHASSCDPYSGNCLDCKHNTTGARCEHCQRGFYGAPVLGSESGTCRQCGCPLTDSSNNFSPTCSAQKLGVSATDTDYVCTACQHGYVGNKCEMCADGFFGDPTILGSSCQPCTCSGNIDPAAIGNCDRKTGECLKCIGNTGGDQCEQCKPQYFGDALKHDCRACGCNSYGAVSGICNNRTGECECKPHYIGMQCDRCEDGHGDIENDCPLCQCNATGSHSDRCDALSGQCQCKPGVLGKRCDTCITGYFGFSPSGCQYCGCYGVGSIENGKCHAITGQCICRPHVTGQKCTVCEDGFYNITSGEGCQSCECHAEGAESNICDQHTGQCRCKVGVTGLKCDKCAPNYYGLSSDGCKQCPVCPAAGHVCDPVTGQCVCPPNTIGEMCESCAPDTWNYHPLKGCEPCQCSSGGSTGPSCDPVTGACACLDGYTGRKCDQCTHGHFGTPCRKCRCHEAGTDPGSCLLERGCSCDNQGQCPCKKNVRGQKCRDCTPMSFSLETSNPNGCTECFCFNRTNFCIQSSYAWQQVNAPNRLALFVQPWQYYERLHGLHVFPGEPATVNSYPTDHTPIYWLLPGPFTGDKVTSYNGFLRFQVSNSNGNYLEGPARPDERYFDYYPMAVLIGNHRVILEHYKKRSDVTESGTYLVKLREDHWKARHHKEIPVTRQMMMVALQNVQAIYVRGTYIERPGEASLSGLSLDIGVWDNSTAAALANNNNTAIGVEACDCPMGYAGISCQNPAEGFCRKKKPNYLDSENILDLVGSAELCSCHGHSRTCDRETCKCTNCDDNTAGDYCEYCIAGYYGDATSGTPNDCTKCACPLEDNSFSATCRALPLDPSGKGYVCDNCQPGYTGTYCESCTEGHYGDPTVLGGSCKPCSCNRDGSLSDACDRMTGQCVCRAGVTGRDCSECRPRHALIGRECHSCDVGCTRDLMTDVDELENAINSYNFTGLVPAPWGRLASIENRTLSMEKRLQDIQKGGAEAQDLLLTLGDPRAPLVSAENIQKEVGYIKERMDKVDEKMESMPAEGERLTADIYRTFGKAREIVRLLERYVIEGGLGPSVPPDLVSKWLEEATVLLTEMQNRTEYLEKRFNRAELELSRAKELLNEVMKQTFNDTAFEAIGIRIDNLTKTLEDARTIVWDTIRHRLNLVDNVTSIDKKMIGQYYDYLTKIKELNATAADVTHDAKDKVQGAKMHLLNIHDDYTEANFTLISKVENLTTECEKVANQLANLLPEYERQWVGPALSYAGLLESNAAYMNNSFITTRNASHWAVKAAQAYQEITDALHNASKAAYAARNASMKTFEETGGGTIVATAYNSLQRSTDLLNEANALDVTGLTESLKIQNITLGDIDDQLNNNKKEHYEATKRFDQFDTMTDRVQAATEQATRIQSQAQDAERKTKEIVQNIQDLNVKVQELVASAGKGILNITDRVKESLDGVKKARQDLEKVRIQATENDNKMEDLTRKLLLLKEKIAVARGKASQIKLSVKSKDEGICMRSYLSPAMPSPTNKIHLEYKPTSDVRNASIFVTQTEQSRTRQSEYMAIELRGQRIVFLWNVGGGDKMLTNLMRIDPIPEKSLRTWYHIDVERRGNAATLNVSLVPNGKPPTAVNTISYDGGGDAVIFNTIPGSTLITLGTPLSSAAVSGGVSRMTRYRVPLEGSPIQFYGNIGDITLDNTKLSLWNFIHDSGHCNASFSEVDEPETGLSKSFLFDDGFAQIPASPYGYDSKSSNIQIVFATYSENGLVYFRGNPNDKDFVSIELAEGQIVFQFYLGGNSKLRLTSRDNYNDGRFHTIVARRYLTNGSLSVDGDADFITQLTPGQLVDLNVRSSEHYVGGVPLSFNKGVWSQYGINWEGFYGCIVKLIPAQGEELDIGAATQTLNVKPNCIQQNDRFVLSNRPISFAGDGYFVVSGLQLDPISVLTFSFRTAAPEGLLVYQSSRLNTRRRRGTFGKGFYSVYLNGGRVFARVGQDGEHVVLQSAAPSVFNDGRWHAVIIKRNFAQIGLYVDDVLGQEASLQQGQEVIASRDGQLFMGGVGRGTYPNDELPVYYAYSGCISDVFLNFERINLLPQKQDNAYLGQCNATLYQVITTGRVLAEEPALSGGEDALVADDSFSPRQWDDASTSRRKMSRYLFEAPVVLEEQEHRRLTHVDPARPPLETELTESSEFESTTATTVAPIPITCSQSSLFAPIPAGGLYGVSGDSFTRFRLPRGFDTSDLSLWIEFRTEKADGLLLAWPNKNWQNYILIQLENGAVVLRTKSSRMKEEVYGVSNPNAYLADSHWHTISIIKKRRQISMEIDGHDNHIIKGAPEKPNLRMKGGLVIGGVPKSLSRTTNRTFTNYAGCIRNFSINNEVQKLVDVKGSRGVFPCYEQQPPGLYLPGEGFVRFDTGTELGLTIADLEFRSDNASDGVLMMATIPNVETGYFSIELHNGQVRTVIKPPGDDADSAVSILEGDYPGGLCDNAWHRVRVEIIGLKFSLRVDNQTTKIGSLNKEILSLLLKVPVYFGGVERSTMNQHSLPQPSKSFKGCLRQVSINGVSVNWYSAVLRKRVVINGCPLFD